MSQTLSGCSSCAMSGCGTGDGVALSPGSATVVALAGNPNVGKTSVFNALTGLRQHTGNWPGKTVMRAEGTYSHGGNLFQVVDLPGTYSLAARSAEEEVARDFLCFERPDVTVVVVDATALERNLNLVLQTGEITDHLVVCVNLLDEARRNGVVIDLEGLSRELGLPVVGTVARTRRGLGDLKDVIARVAQGELLPRPRPVTYPADIEAAVAQLMPDIAALVGDRLPHRWVTLRVIEGDQTILEKIAADAGPALAVFSVG